jgi:hypothetical protein
MSNLDQLLQTITPTPYHIIEKIIKSGHLPKKKYSIQVYLLNKNKLEDKDNLIKLLIEKKYSEFTSSIAFEIIRNTSFNTIDLLLTNQYEFENVYNYVKHDEKLLDFIIYNNNINESQCIELLNKHKLNISAYTLVKSMTKNYYILTEILLHKLKENKIKFYNIIDFSDVFNFKKFIDDGHFNLLKNATEYICTTELLWHFIISSISDENLIEIIDIYKNKNVDVKYDYNLKTNILQFAKKYNKSDVIINKLSELISLSEKDYKNITGKPLKEPLSKSFCSKKLLYNLGLYDLRKILNRVGISMINDKSILELSKNDICEFLGNFNEETDTHKVKLYTKNCHNDGGDLYFNDWKDLGDDSIVQDTFGYCFSYHDIKGLRENPTTANWPRGSNSRHPYTRQLMSEAIPDPIKYRQFITDIDELYDNYDEEN